MICKRIVFYATTFKQAKCTKFNDFKYFYQTLVILYLGQLTGAVKYSDYFFAEM